jgi:hypothetical protein
LNTLTTEEIDKIVDFSVNSYNNDVYHVEDVNNMLKILDDDPTQFAIRKNYTMLSFPDFSINYEIIINGTLVFVISDDFTRVISAYINGKKRLHLEILPSEAREKISSKYLQYIMRLEDHIGVPYDEILNMDNKT